MRILYVILLGIMAIQTSDIVSLSDARTRFSELAEEVRKGAEKVITRNGRGYVALIDAAKLDYYHRLESQLEFRDTLLNIERGLDDVDAGRTFDAKDYFKKLKKRLAKK